MRGRFREIHWALKEAKRLRTALPETEPFLAGYLVVFISGVFEDCVEKLFTERARLTSDSKIVSFIAEMMHQRFRNPDFDNIKGFLNALDPDYKRRLNAAVDPVYQDGLNAIVTNKNDLAHGSSVKVTLTDVVDYYFRARRVFQALEDILF